MSNTMTPAQRQWQAATNRSNAEISFERLWQQIAKLRTTWKPDFYFHPDRNWRTDFAIPSIRVAVEIEGFGHKITARFNEDIEKYNMMQEEGWTLLRYTPQMLRDDPYSCIQQVERVVLRKMCGGKVE